MKKKLTVQPKQLKPLYIAMIVDAWFPDQKSGKKGVYGGGQVHVRELSQRLKGDYHCDISIFYDRHASVWARIFWTMIVPFRIALAHQRQGFDLIHAHGFNAGFVGKLASIILKIPVVHTVHGSHLMDQKASSVKAKLEQWLLTGIRYDAQITVSSVFLRYKRATPNCYVIRNGVNVMAFDAVEAKKAKEPTIIWVGRRDKVKALEVLHQAFARVKETIPHAHLELVSGGRLFGKALVKAYKRAWVFCLPSYAEGQPITLLEAWAAKLPVVVTRVGDNPQMVKHGVNGYLVEPGNPESLAQELLKLLQSPLKAKRLGLNGYNLVKHSYSWDDVTSQTYKVYLHLLQSRSYL